MRKNGILFLRVSIAIIFLWFGILKFFSGQSPAEEIAVKTISAILPFGLSDSIILLGLAILEVLIGLGLLLNIYLRATLFLLWTQMAGTFMPLVLFTDELFRKFPYALTLEGQYIVKNLVILSAGIVIGSSLAIKKQGQDD